MSSAAEFEALLSGLQAAGLSGAEIARLSGLTRGTVWRLENGMCRAPTLDTYVRIAGTYQREVGPVPPLNYRRR